MSGEKKDSYFTLQLTNDSFSLRCKDAFSSLDAIEKKHEAYERSQESSKRSDRILLMKEDPVEDFYWGSERSKDITNNRTHSGRQETRSGNLDHWKMRSERNNKRRDSDGFRQPFRRPPPRRRHAVPDFKKNPEKWTCYSLEDVNNADMSENSNHRAAFEFLTEMRKIREAKNEEEKFEVGETACSKGLMSFSKPNASAGSMFSKKNAKADSPPGLKEMPISVKQSSEEKKLCFEEETDLQSIVSVDKSQTKKDHSCHADMNSEKSSGNVVLSFKARKSVRRNIRHKDSDEPED